MRALAFGGGTDSSAILAGWIERDLQKTQPINVCLFADTGGERPETYTHIERISAEIQKYGLPEITIVRKHARTPEDFTLEGNCLRRKMLPSLAYGFKSCSQKYKIQPQDKFFNNNSGARAIWKAGGHVEKLIGYEFNETRRWAKAPLEDEKYLYRYPLVEWEWTRADAVAALKRVFPDMPLPGKSSCYFCPASTKPEIDELKKTHPDLYARAIAMEDNALHNLQSVKGLGRRFSWREYSTTKEPAVEMASCMFCVDES